MIGKCFGEKGDSSRGMYIRCIADIAKLVDIVRLFSKEV